MIDDYLEHMPPLVPADDVQEMSRAMLSKCPVAHSDLDTGFWIVNRHEDVVSVLQNWRVFKSGNKGVRVPTVSIDQPPLVPIDSNPPLHRQVREIMNPFLTPAAIAPWEPEFRNIIGQLLDPWVPDGHCDFAAQFAKAFPSQITAKFLFGVTDEAELDQLRAWVRRLSYDLYRESPEVMGQTQQELVRWSMGLVERRRAKPTGDIISAMIEHTVEDGRHLTDLEIAGGIQILLLGGFATTADAACNIVIRLIKDPGLEVLLRDKPELIPIAIEEILRLEPPVSTRPRVATEDIEIGGQLIKAGQRVLCNYIAANIDPDEWDRPQEFDLERRRNRVMTFGGGPHRCIGSNQARVSLQIMVEELLERVTDIHYAEGQTEFRTSMHPSAWRACDALPITFTPLAR